MASNTFLAMLLLLAPFSHLLGQERKDQSSCQPTSPAFCNPSSCQTRSCLGPENYGINPPKNPQTCNGDWVTQIEGFYWSSYEDGVEYAIITNIEEPVATLAPRNGAPLINATYENPNFDWNFGFKLGAFYNTTCDGWTLGVLWTRYEGSASSHIEAEREDNQTILPLWTNFSNNPFLPTFARNATTRWSLRLNLIDLSLAREFWTSKRLTLSPHVGLRIAYIDQRYKIQYRGGSFSETDPVQNDFVKIRNDFKGVGLRSGLDAVWHLGCGWAIYNNLAISILYGDFDINHKEFLREAISPFQKLEILSASDEFKASGFAADLALGLEWSAKLCDCAYMLAVRLGWEHHLFLNQNQMWRVSRTQITNVMASTGLNTYQQRRGDLGTQGWTLSIAFAF